MKTKLFVLVCLLQLLVACATTQQTQTISTANPLEIVGQLETEMANAKANQVDVLAPGLFNDAQSSLMQAQKALEKGSKLSDISRYVAEGTASLEKAEEIAQVSRTILADTNQARDKALKVGADTLGSPYMDVEKQYLKLTKAIENDNLSYAQKNASEVMSAYQDLEIMAIKDSSLGTARDLMFQADETKLQKIAPTAYADAEQALNAADSYVEQNPYDAETIKQKAENAEFMVQRAITIGDSSKKFKEMSPEESALYVEALLANMGNPLNTGDIRNQSVEAQLNTLIKNADTMGLKYQSIEKENQSNQARIAELEQQLSGLQGYASEQEAAKKRLTVEREFNERFNKVQGYFQPDEAEVYKQKGKLVVRLKGIQFPVGKATLTPENYNLLSKVQQAILTFDQPLVTIEGHTDSTGSAKTNLELSQKRAESVRAYLIANNTLPGDRIRAVGYGPDRPLAANTTAEGRAINRRIDVLISPSQTP